MTRRKLLKALLVAALIFVYAAFSAACGNTNSFSDEYDPSDIVTRPGDDHNGMSGDGSESPDPEEPANPEDPDPEEPDPEDPDIPEPVIFGYSFVYGIAPTETSSGKAEEGTEIERPTIDADVPYYDFLEWRVGGQSVGFPYVLTGETVFTAFYSPKQYKITYVTNGGEDNDKNPDVYSIESPGFRFVPISRPCYEFGGWYADETLNEKIEAVPSENPHELTLYAGWNNPAHDFAANHVCVVCGETTDPAHRYDANHHCTVCGAAHAEKNHVFDENHTCTVCGTPYGSTVHSFDPAHRCVVCGYVNPEQEHVYGADYTCTLCGTVHAENEHVYNAAHECTVCGKPHARPVHVYGADYLCEICGAAHGENEHTFNTSHLCAVCGKPHDTPEHIYNDDYFCEICGDEFTGVRPWKGNIAAAFSGGDGTAKAPYEIGDGAELALLAALVNGATTDGDGLYLEKYYTLTADIDLGGREWTPIGRGCATALSEDFNGAFKGHFAGNNKTIGNFKITKLADSSAADHNAGTFYSVGLFGALGGGSVAELRITGFEIDITSAGASATYNVGGLAGIVSSSSSVTSCYIEGEINLNIIGDINAGMLIGNCDIASVENPAGIENCRVRGTVFVKGTKLAIAGGLIGVTGYCGATKCYADVDVTAESTKAAYGAGFIGYYKVTAHVDDCYALGDVTVTGQNAYVDGFAYRTVTEKWIKNCLRLETQTLTGNGKPVAGKTAAATAATAQIVEEAAASIFGKS